MEPPQSPYTKNLTPNGQRSDEQPTKGEVINDIPVKVPNVPAPSPVTTPPPVTEQPEKDKDLERVLTDVNKEVAKPTQQDKSKKLSLPKKAVGQKIKAPSTQPVLVICVAVVVAAILVFAAVVAFKPGSS